MNKTAAFIVFGVLTLASIAGTLILQIHRPDATASFTTFVFQIAGSRRRRGWTRRRP